MAYPELTDPNYLRKVSRRAELFQNKRSPSKLLKNYFHPENPYDTLLIFHAPNQGKVCSAINIAENFASNKFEKILVLSKSRTSLENFKKELTLGFCSESKYISKRERMILSLPDKTVSEDIIIQKRKIKNEIRKKIETYYQFLTFSTFVQNGIGNVDNRLVIILEAHELVNSTVSKDRILNAFQNSIGSRLVMLTATPVVDKLNEFVDIYNFLVEKDKQIVASDILKDNYINIKGFTCSNVLEEDPRTTVNVPVIDSEKIKTVQNNLLGKISFLNADIKTVPKLLENPSASAVSPDYPLQIIRVQMSETQFLGYKFAFKKDCENETTENEFSNAHHASNFVFENGEFGNNGIESVFEEYGSLFGSKTQLELKNPQDIFMFQHERNGGQLTRFSGKMSLILQNIENFPGVHLVYSKYSPKLFSFVLEANGFAEFPNGSSNHRYAQLDSENMTRMLEIFNSKENKSGKIIKTLIVSKGFPPLENVRHVHLMDPISNIILNKIVYENSHKQLDSEQRYTMVHRYASVDPNDENTFVDEYKYNIISEKQKAISKLVEIVKESAFDCVFFRDRNLVQKCLQGIELPKPKELVYNSFHPNENLVDRAIQKISDLFSTSFIWTIDRIQDEMEKDGIDSRTLFYTLEKIINERIKVKDTYGRQGTVIYRGKYYVFTPLGMKPNTNYWNRVVPL